MGDVERLRDAVKPPSEELVPFREWSELERRLGVAVPPDYRQLVATFEPGVFDEFIHIQQPKSRFEAIRLVSFSLAYRKRLLLSGKVGEICHTIRRIFCRLKGRKTETSSAG
jgi:hypothetical protein